MKGLVHIYAGDGKGKTTASLGLIIRALGHNKKVVWISFGKKKNLYGEYSVLNRLNIPVYFFASQYPCFLKKVDKEKLKLECVKGIEEVFMLYKKNLQQRYDIIVLDEILVCVRDNFLTVKDLKEIIRNKPKNIELVLTGRANKKILEQLRKDVDYITIINKIKHPYDIGIKARKGIEF